MGSCSMMRLLGKRCWASCLCLTALVFLLVTLQVVVELSTFEKWKMKSGLQDVLEQKHSYLLLKTQAAQKSLRSALHTSPRYPIMLWWSPLTGETGRLVNCGMDVCFSTINRTYQYHPMTKVFLFYGTDFNVNSLPLPRKVHHDWALFHEESPKNNYKLFHKPSITLFNYTATFSRHSHLALTTQYLENIEVLTSLKYMIPLQKKNILRVKLAPLVYVQSDCNPPSDRDSYVQMLMKYIEVDSYGECLHNRNLPRQLKNPSSMEDENFYNILAQYKFILAFENAVCNDYITEKLWRPLKLGVVPVYYGSPSIADWLPSSKSAVLVNNFPHPRELASYIRELDTNDEKYEAYLEWKLSGNISNEKLMAAVKNRKWGVQDMTQDNYIDAFECMVCRNVWENIRRQEKGLEPKRWHAEANHLTCPTPEAFTFSPQPVHKTLLRQMWRASFEQSKKEAQALRYLVDRNTNFTSQEFWNLVFENEFDIGRH